MLGDYQPSGRTILGIAVHGSIVYLSEISGGYPLEIIDASNPSQVRTLSQTNQWEAVTLLVSGDYLYICDSVLRIANIQDARRPLSESLLADTTADPWGLFVKSPFIYMVGAEQTLRIVDASQQRIQSCDAPSIWTLVTGYQPTTIGSLLPSARAASQCTTQRVRRKQPNIDAGSGHSGNCAGCRDRMDCQQVASAYNCFSIGNPHEQQLLRGQCSYRIAQHRTVSRTPTATRTSTMARHLQTDRPQSCK